MQTHWLPPGCLTRWPQMKSYSNTQREVQQNNSILVGIHSNWFVSSTGWRAKVRSQYCWRARRRSTHRLFLHWTWVWRTPLWTQSWNVIAHLQTITMWSVTPHHPSELICTPLPPEVSSDWLGPFSLCTLDLFYFPLLFSTLSCTGLVIQSFKFCLSVHFFKVVCEYSGLPLISLWQSGIQLDHLRYSCSLLWTQLAHFITITALFFPAK